MIKRILIILLMSICSQSFSQENYAMTFGYYDPVIADTTEYYDHLSVSCYVVNTGTDTIFSQIRAMISSNPGVGEESVREIFSVSFEDGTGLNPGDSIYFPAPEPGSINGAYDIILPSNNYYDGDNIIVVWPVIDGAISFTTEQFSKDIFVNESTSSVDEKSISEIKILVSSSLIEISSSTIVDKVQLFNVEGKLVAESQSNKILKNNLKSGIYLLKVIQKGKLVSHTVFID